MATTVISSWRPVNAAGRHPLPNRRPSPEEARFLQGAKDLLHFWLSAQEEHDAAQALPSLEQGVPATPAPRDEAAAPADSTGDKPDVPQQQVQGQQEPRESQSTGSPDGPAPPVPAKSNGRHPLPSSRPKPKSEPQLQKKRKRVDEEEDDDDDEQVKKRDEEKKKSDGKKKDGKKPEDGKNSKPFVCHCGSRFPRQDHLTRHVRIVHGIVGEDGVQRWETYECDVCRQLFTRKDNLKQHRKHGHPEAHKAEPAFVPRVVLVTADEEEKETAPSRTASPSPTASATLTASPTPDAENGQA